MASRAYPVAAQLNGYIADLPTPFDEIDRIDLTALENLCERQINAGACAIVVAETTGESSTLTPDEHNTIVRCAVSVACKRAAVIAGAGSNSTSQAIALAKQAEAAGADAIMSVTPYYNKPMQSGIHAHFLAIAEATALPIVLHDIPSRTNRNIADETIERLANSEQFVGIRDAAGDVTRPVQLRPLVHSNFRLLCGDDSTALAYLANGGDGCVSIIANVMPDLCRVLFFNCVEGEIAAARDIMKRLGLLSDLISGEATPAAVKYALYHMNLMKPVARLPIVALDSGAKATVAAIIDFLHHEQQPPFGQQQACEIFGA